MCLATTACSSDDKAANGAEKLLTINATIGGETRSSGVTSFADGDKIGVYMGSYKNVAYATTDGSSFSAVAEGIYFNNDKHSLAAYYPYSTDDKIEVNTAEQSDKLDILCTDSTTMYITLNTANLTFRHLMSRVTLNFSLNYGYDETIDISKISDAKLSGLITKAEFTAPSTLTAGTEKGDLAITPATTTESLIIVPQQSSAVTLQLRYDGKLYTKTFNANYEAGKSYSYDIKISKFALTVDSWEEGNDATDKDMELAMTVASAIDVITDPAKARRFDIALDDGTFLRGVQNGAYLSEYHAKHCVGLVYWTTSGSNGKTNFDDELMKNDYPNYNHGLIMSLKETGDGNNGRFLYQKKYDNAVADILTFQNSEDFAPENKNLYGSIQRTVKDTNRQGYSATKVLRAYNVWLKANYSDIYSDYCVNMIEELERFITAHPHPKNATEWYIPSGEEFLLYGTVEGETGGGTLLTEANEKYQVIVDAFNAYESTKGMARTVNSFYWCPFQVSQSDVWYIDSYHKNGYCVNSADHDYPGGIGSMRKNQDTRFVRPICAF
jgi:hypothetical protein